DPNGGVHQAPSHSDQPDWPCSRQCFDSHFSATAQKCQNQYRAKYTAQLKKELAKGAKVRLHRCNLTLQYEMRADPSHPIRLVEAEWFSYDRWNRKSVSGRIREYLFGGVQERARCATWVLQVPVRVDLVHIA